MFLYVTFFEALKTLKKILLNDVIDNWNQIHDSIKVENVDVKCTAITYTNWYSEIIFFRIMVILNYNVFAIKIYLSIFS